MLLQSLPKDQGGSGWSAAQLIVQQLLVGFLDQIVQRAQAVLFLDLGLAFAPSGDLVAKGEQDPGDDVVLDLVAAAQKGKQTFRVFRDPKGLGQRFVVPQDSRVDTLDLAGGGVVVEAKDAPRPEIVLLTEEG